MIIYRKTSRKIRTRDLISKLRQQTISPSFHSYDSSLDFLITSGELESGIADAACAEHDSFPELLRTLRLITIRAAVFFLQCYDRNRWGNSPILPGIRAALELLEEIKLPVIIEQPILEGFAFYNLLPEAHVEAAEKFAREQAPKNVLCIGIRSIGTVLSALVSAVLIHKGCSVRSFTVRPRGHPFDRYIRLSDKLKFRLVKDPDTIFAIADEGPGLSGSSLHSLLSFLEESGISSKQIFVFPSWNPEPHQLNHPGARQRWATAQKYWTDLETMRWRPETIVADFSAGRWRPRILPDEKDYPAVQPQHEALKFLLKQNHQLYLMKFAGLGGYGTVKMSRALKLAQNGFTPEPISFHRGFIAHRFVAGKPLSCVPVTSFTFMTFARYLHFLQNEFPTERATEFDELCEMTENNLHELFPDQTIPNLESVRSAFRDEVATEIDGRMLSHEWIVDGNEYYKTDALDHCANDFFPGCTSILWDVASTIFEMNLDSHAEKFFLELLRIDDCDLLDFFKLAYGSFRAGYCKMQADSLRGTEDGIRFSRLQECYCDRLSKSIPVTFK